MFRIWSLFLRLRNLIGLVDESRCIMERVILSNRYAVSELHGLGRRSVVELAPPRDLVPPTTKAHAKTERVILSAKRSGAVELRAAGDGALWASSPCGISQRLPRKPSGRGTREKAPLV